MFNANCNQISIDPYFLSNQITITGSCNSIYINKELSTLHLNGHNCSLNSQTSIHYFQMNGHNNKITCVEPMGNLIINGHNNKIIIHSPSQQIIVNGHNNTINCPFVRNGVQSNGVNNKINGYMNMYPNYSMNFPMAQPQVHPIQNNMPMMNNVDNRNQIPVRNDNNNNNNVSVRQLNGNSVNIRLINQNNNNNNNNDGSMEEQRRKQMLEIRKDVINNLKEFLYKNTAKEIKTKQQIESECSICLEKYQPNDKLILFNCEFHYFHKKCILDWLKKNHLCPLCNHHIMDGILEEGEELRL